MKYRDIINYVIFLVSVLALTVISDAQTPAKGENESVTLNNLGVDAFEKGRNDEAIAALKRSIELDPKFERAYYNLANVYTHVGRSADAVALLQTAVKLDPKHLEARTKLCDSYLTLGQNETAA